MAEVTTNSLIVIGAEVAERRLSDSGIKFNPHQRKVMIACMVSMFVGGAATSLKMLADGHDLSAVQRQAEDVAVKLKNEKQ